METKKRITLTKETDVFGTFFWVRIYEGEKELDSIINSSHEEAKEAFEKAKEGKKVLLLEETEF